MKRLVAYFMFMLGLTTVSQAQLVFPNGTTLNLSTSKQILYIETEIKFYTGTYHITDYEWERQPDSVNSEWDHQACMNGDCKVGLPASGNFITDFGINDTTGYIRFHLNSYGISGSTQVKYLVRNKHDFNDVGALEFNITYTNRTGLGETSQTNSIELFPNPCNQTLHLSISRNEWKDIQVLNSCGQQMPIELDSNGNLNTSSYPVGLYFVIDQQQRSSFVVSR